MQLDLALPELKIFFCSLTCDLVTGRPLALKLGLSRRNRQVQLRIKDGQLRTMQGSSSQESCGMLDQEPVHC